MGPEELRRRRRQMGASVTIWGSAPGAVAEIGENYWAVLTGAPSPDVNVSLVHEDDPTALARVLELIDSAGCPAMLDIAGDATALAVPDRWQPVGNMPFMSSTLADMATGIDPRVRPAEAADEDAVLDLCVQAYGIEESALRASTRPVFAAGDPRCRFWLLVDDGVPVSTVLTAQADDSVTLWCMATPEQYGRRGYGRALLAHVLHAAKAAGATTGLLGATAAGYPLYAATGWTTVEHWQIFVNAESAQFAH